MSYVLEFTLPGLPKMTNQQTRQMWQAKFREAKRWKQQVGLACWRKGPDKPLEKAKLTLIRCSANEPDTDGLISGFKHIIDGLVECGVLANDKPSNIGIPDYRYEYARPKQGKIRVRVEAIE